MGTYNDVAEHQKGTEFLQRSSLPVQTCVGVVRRKRVALGDDAHSGLDWLCLHEFSVTVRAHDMCVGKHAGDPGVRLRGRRHVRVRLPVKALDDEGVLQAQLYDCQQRTGQVERVQLALHATRYHRHDGEVADGELAHGGPEEQAHVQAAGGVLSGDVLALVQAIEHPASQCGACHEQVGHQVHDVVHTQRQFPFGMVPVMHVYLVHNEGDQAGHQHQQAVDGAHEHVAQGEAQIVVVVMLVHQTTNVLPHHVGHGRGE